MVRMVKGSPPEYPDKYYLLANGGWWLIGSHPLFGQRPYVEVDAGKTEHGGQAQLQSHGLVLLLI